MSLPGRSQQHDKNSSSSAFYYDDANQSGKNTSGDVLQESDMTHMTDGTSTSEEDTGWLSGIGADFRNIANSLKGAVPPTIGAIGDIANFVQRSALSVAAELAQLERDSSDDEGGDIENSFRLPWEIPRENSTTTDLCDYQEDAKLKSKILALSVDHATFLKPFSVKGSSRFSEEEESKFIILDERRIHLIRRLLVIDESLAATHAHLSGRSDVKETVFWTNYFFNCEKARREHLEYLQSMSLVSSCTLEETPATDADETGSQSSQNSLVPADDSSDQGLGADAGNVEEDEEDSSYIQVNRGGIATPPCSLQSVEDLILVTKTLSGEK